jgi:hypothetical protein
VVRCKSLARLLQGNVAIWVKHNAQTQLPYQLYLCHLGSYRLTAKRARRSGTSAAEDLQVIGR